MSRILVVEDDAIISWDIQQTLIRLGYDVPRTARSGDEALGAVAEAVPDLVLMDIKLRGKADGIETAAELRRRWDVPVVYLTSHSDDTTLARAKETGPHGYLLKPFDERDLRTAIEVALRKHELERQLAARERWFATTLESIGDAVIATDAHDGITFMNPIAERLTGWQREEALGHKLADVFELVDEHGVRLESPAARAVRGRFAVAIPRGTRLIPRQGDLRYIDDSSAPIVDDRGSLLGGVVVFRDVTERKRIDQRLAFAERMASVGTLAAGMAHEINNPLAAVMSNVEFASMILERFDEVLRGIAGAEELVHQVEDLRAALRDADTAADRIRLIVLDLKRFTHSDGSRLDVVDLPDIIDAAVRMTAEQVRPHAMVSREYGTTPLVDGNEGQLVQVVTALLSNAAQAMTAGQPGHIRIHTRTDDAGRAVIEVRDDGIGIRPEHLGRIFDPFFTTRDVGAGMGLGLAISHQIIERLRGDIAVESRPGTGTTVRVSIPPSAGARAAPAEEVAAVRAGRRGRVLVIDDDVAVGRGLERILQRDHDVVTEIDARRALARIALHEPFDVIFCDINMPHLDGMAVYAAIDSATPEVARRIVFLTGGSCPPRLAAFLAQTDNLAVAKPFTGAEIRAIVAERLT